ncbi:MAG: hypothetical protein ACE5GZ_11420 [Gammaproteobacteria bacterium]
MAKRQKNVRSMLSAMPLILRRSPLGRSKEEIIDDGKDKAAQFMGRKGGGHGLVHGCAAGDSSMALVIRVSDQ